jgi:hypothetical protein
MVGSGHTGSDAGHPTGDTAFPVGARVLLLDRARCGRVVARAHGGLLYKVRLEGGTGATLACAGSDLLRLHDDP